MDSLMEEAQVVPQVETQMDLAHQIFIHHIQDYLQELMLFLLLDHSHLYLVPQDPLQLLTQVQPSLEQFKQHIYHQEMLTLSLLTKLKELQSLTDNLMPTKELLT